jgi:hypothetical protein
MFSMVLLTKWNYLDFCGLNGQSHEEVCLRKIFWLLLYDVVVCSNILQIRETGFTSSAPPV